LDIYQVVRFQFFVVHLRFLLQSGYRNLRAL
jgi:hypothetical protein